MSDRDTLVEVGKLFHLLQFDLSRICLESETVASLEMNFDISEYDFLGFAENDLKENNNHGFVNALSNAKRAIDCQVDKVLKLFGFETKRNFPQKIEILRELGLAAPRIINKVVKTRNYLEHEYKSPEQGMAEDAVDVAALFILLTDKTLQFFPGSFRIGSILPNNEPVYDKYIGVEFDQQNKIFLLNGIAYQGEIPPSSSLVLFEPKNFKHVGYSILTPQDKKYKTMIRLALLGAWAKVDPKEQIRNCIDELCV